MNRYRRLGLALLLAVWLPACGSDDADEGGRGTASFTIWGEEYIEQQIPAVDFEDAWSVRFDKFLIVVGDIYVRDGRGAEGGKISGARLFDLVESGPHPIDSFGVAARAWDDVGYTVSAATANTEPTRSVSQDDLEMMREGGLSLFASGAAAREDEIKTFAWGFSNTTRYADCVSDSDGREVHGIVVANGGDEVVQLTIHGDHFFYDDLASVDAVPRFDAIASADRDADGNVTLDELEAVKLVAIPEGSYGTGGASHIDDLGAFVRAQTGSLGHFRGEGHCVASSE